MRALSLTHLQGDGGFAVAVDLGGANGGDAGGAGFGGQGGQAEGGDGAKGGAGGDNSAVSVPTSSAYLGFLFAGPSMK